jgi:hypothetical protein
MSTVTVLAAYELFDNRSGESLKPLGSLEARNVCKFMIPTPHGVDIRDYAELAARANIARIARRKYPNKDVRYFMPVFTFAVDNPIAGGAPVTPWPQSTVARKMQEFLFNPSQEWAGALCQIHQFLQEEDERSEQAAQLNSQTG